jgi:hypothetical protein
MTTQITKPPALVYRGDRYRLNFTAGTILTLLAEYGTKPTSELFAVFDNQNKSAGIPGGSAGGQWTPPPPKPKGNFKNTHLNIDGEPRKRPPKPDPDTDPEDDDVPPLALPDDVERWPDTLREHCTYYEPSHDRLVAVLKMLDYCRLVDFTALDVAITDLGRRVVEDMRDAENMARTIGDATGRLTPVQQYLVGDERDTEVGSYTVPFESLPFNITAATRTASTLYSAGTLNPDDLFGKLPGSFYSSAVSSGIKSPDAAENIDTGAVEHDESLPIRRNMQRQPSYRQFLWILYNDRNVFALAYGGVTEENTRIVGTKSTLGDIEDIDKHPDLKKLKQGRTIAKKARKFAELVLGGGPEAVWAGKPLNPKDVHADVVSFVTAGRPGFVDYTALGSSMAWETYDNSKLTMEDFERARAALHNGYGRGLIAEHADQELVTLDAAEVAKLAIDGSKTKGKTIVTAEKYVVRTADKLIQDMGLDVDIRPVMTHAGIPMDVMCTHTSSYRLGNGEEAHHRCNAQSIGGSGYCEKHGGSYLDPLETQSLVSASQQKIFSATSKAVDVIVDIMLNSTNDAVKLRAAEQILNRGGLSESREININVDTGAPAEKTAAQSVREKLFELMPSKAKQQEIEAQKAAGQISDYGEIIDAEVEPELA